MWIVIEGVGALTTPIGPIRKALHAHEATKDILTQISEGKTHSGSMDLAI